MVYPYRQMGVAQPVTVVRSDGARRIYRDWYYNEFYPNREEQMSRLDSYVERFMLLLAVSSAPGLHGVNSLVITPEIATAAVAMGRRQLKVRQMHSPIIADTQAAGIEQAIIRAAKTAGEQGLTRRELQKASNAHRKGLTSWDNAFGAVVKNGNLVKFDPLSKALDTSRGRPPSDRWRFARGAE